MRKYQKLFLFATAGFLMISAGGCKAFRAAFDEPERARVKAGDPARKSSFFSLRQQPPPPSMLQKELSPREYQIMQQYTRDNQLKPRDLTKETDEEKARRKWVF